jgi:uncharacterized iron-regulated membrane protein
MDATHPTPRGAAVYRVLWRWHFYAGLFVMPFLVILALTGTLYCFQPQIEPLLYRSKLIVQDRGQPRLPLETLRQRVEHAAPAGATLATVSIDTRRTRSAEFIVKLPAGDSESIYVDPYDGRILGAVSVDDRFIQQMRMLHRKLLLGRPGELLMELVACWTLVMIVTGVCLWWPRGNASRGAVLMPRRSAPGRIWWKELHSAIGVWFAFGAVAFVITGLPWTGFWGKGFQNLATATSLGSPGQAGGGALKSIDKVAGRAVRQHARAPASPGRTGQSMPGMVMDDLPLRQVPWAVGLATVPAGAARTDSPTPTVTLDRIVQVAAARGIDSGYQIVLPGSSDGVFTVSWFPADPKAERTLHIDRFSAEVLEDTGYKDYGVASRAVAYGTALHMGRYFGLANQIICAAISLSLVVLALSGFWMWWKRRPQGKLAAPPRPALQVPMRTWTFALVVLGLLFPLLGASLIAVWVLDRCIGGTFVSRSA